MTLPVAPPPAETAEERAPVAWHERVAEEFAEPPAPRRSGPIVAGAILIALGFIGLAGNVLPARGAQLFLGLGIAFALARVITGRLGYAVPAGILLGFGAFIAATEMNLLSNRDGGGLFFMLLGLGFVASYAIAASPGRVWPLMPAAALVGFGLLLQGVLSGWPVEQFVWLAAYWPVALIVFGGWLLVQDQVPAAWRAPLTLVGVSVLVLIGFLVAAGGLASVT